MRDEMRLLIITWTVAALASGAAVTDRRDEDDPTTHRTISTTDTNNRTTKDARTEGESESQKDNNDSTRSELSGKQTTAVGDGGVEKVDLELDDFADADAPSVVDVDDAVDAGLRMMHELYSVKEPQLYKMGLYLNEDEPAARVAAFSSPNIKATIQARYGYAAVQAALKIREKYPETRSRRNPGNVALPRAKALTDQCPLRGQPRCPQASRRYRTSDGTCNNPEHPWRGASMLPMQRFLMPSYDDGVQSPRRSVRGGRLPSAREISIRIHRDRNVEMGSVTMMFMQWGQFLDHDVTSTAQARAFNNSVPRCCDRGGTDFLPPEFMHPECMPISVPEDDWFLERFQIRCIEFIRSAPSSRIDCEMGWREQINQVTSYIDASTVYGSDMERTDSLRVFRRGLMQYGRTRTEDLTPPDPPGGEICHMGAVSSKCFRGGDGRMGEQPGLTAFHTVWLRYHNRLATILFNLNPHWSDEKVYQEARRVLGAIVQHITYKEFLPIVLGQEVMELFGLNLERKGYYTGYDVRVNPAPAAAFSTAAFRFGHSLVQNSYVRSDGKHRPMFNNVSIHEELDNHENIWSIGSVDRLILGFSNQVSQRRDEFICRELTNHLFQNPGQPFGMDLAAVNIQRGRDHGIPGYTEWREPCGLSQVRDWEDLEPLMSFETIQRFRSLYEDVDDIDLYPGGLAEKPVRGGVIGPTFACIIAQQFSNFRKGDRFWYENGDFESSFTPAQLQQIRKVTFAKVLCQVLPEIETIQPFVFLTADEFRNERMSCEKSEMDNFDLRAWEERKFTQEDLPVSIKLDRLDKGPSVHFQNLQQVNNKLDFGAPPPDRNGALQKLPPEKKKVDNKLDFGGSPQVDDKLGFEHKGTPVKNTTRPREDLIPVPNIRDRIDFLAPIQSTTPRNKGTSNADFEVLFFTSNKGQKKPEKQTTDFDWNQLFEKTKIKRSLIEYYNEDDSDEKLTSDDYSSDDDDYSRKKKRKKKPTRLRPTTNRPTTKRIYYQNRPLNSDYFNPLHVKLTNVTTATVDISEDKYGYRRTTTERGYYSTTRRPLQYAENSFVLHPTVTKNTVNGYLQGYVQSSTTKLPEYQVNINIQYVGPTTPKTDININKVNGRPNVHIIENSYASSPYVPIQSYYEQTTTRPVHIIPIRTTKRPYNDGYKYSSTHRPNIYDDYKYSSTNRPSNDDYKYTTTNRPNSYFEEIYDSRPNTNYHRPYTTKRPSYYDEPYYVPERPTYDHDRYEDKPFSTSRRPYIYRPSESYLSMFDELHTTTKRPTYVYSYVNKVTRRPTIPSYLYLDRYKDNQRDDKYKYANSDGDSDSDSDSDIYYVGDKEGYDGGDRDGDDGDKNFVKISSVQGNKFLHRGTKEQIIHTAQQKEGELELFESLEPYEFPAVEEIDKLLVDIIPRESRKDDWIMYNELKDDLPDVEGPVFRSVISDTAELPKPLEQFWNRQDADGEKSR